jgi:hypothetical protein
LGPDFQLDAEKPFPISVDDKVRSPLREGNLGVDLNLVEIRGEISKR